MKIILTEKEWEQLQEYTEWCVKAEIPCDACEQDEYGRCCGDCEKAYKNKYKQKVLNDEIMKQQIIQDYLKTNRNLNVYKNLMEKYAEMYDKAKTQLTEIKDKINIEFVRD